MKLGTLVTVVALVTLTAGGVRPLPAQLPSREEVERLLRDPAASQAIQQRVAQSGLSSDQIRARLQAAGYPSTLLDSYIGKGPAAALGTPSDSVLQAMTILGLGTAADLQAYSDSLRMAAFAAAPISAAGLDATGINVFGLDVFQRPSTQFIPDLSGPVDDSYRLGPGDVLVLILTGDVELVHSLEVTREGFVVVPQVGQIFLSRLTLEQARILLRQRLGRSYSGIRAGTTKVEVTVGRVRMVQVYVIGEVARPGSYQIPSVSSALTALYQGGGPTERGSFRTITVRRGRDTVSVFDLYDYLLTGNTEGDISIESGDVLFVPVHGPQVKVVGAVVRPAIYELEPGETLADLLPLAGGFRADAELRRLTVHRILPAPERGPGPIPRAVIDVPLSPAATSDGAGEVSRGVSLSRVRVPPLRLEDGDSVVVDEILPPLQSLFVSIHGMVNKPGRFPWREGMTLRELVTLARGPSVGAYLRTAEIARLPASRAEGELSETIKVPLDSTYLFERDASGKYLGAAGISFPEAGSAPEVILEPFDRVIILRQPEFELQRTVTITGEVRFPGPYAIATKDERVSDLIERAGGLLPTAYIEGGRYFRELDAAGRIDVDLAAAVIAPHGTPDIILQPGDSLDIPEYIPTVRVTGAVTAPTSVMYREGAGLEYYIANAGGYARGADRGRVNVRFANGSARVSRQFLFFLTDPRPGPGSTITVPSKPESEPLDVTRLMGSVAQIFAATVAIIAIATR